MAAPDRRADPHCLAENDNFLSVGYAEEFGRLITGAQVTVIPECGHLLHIEKPGDFVSAVNDHIRGAAQ